MLYLMTHRGGVTYFCIKCDHIDIGLNHFKFNDNTEVCQSLFPMIWPLKGECNKPVICSGLILRLYNREKLVESKDYWEKFVNDVTNFVSFTGDLSWRTHDFYQCTESVLNNKFTIKQLGFCLKLLQIPVVI